MSQRTKAAIPRITATAMRMLQIRLRMQQPQQRKQLPMQLPMQLKQQHPNPGDSYLRLLVFVGGGGIDGP
uniref:Uncharacterized protein n=1 Tax=Noccaea caerulescens TaxID=107243 RepID=A0A1J3JC13_NOCCA